MQAKKLSHISIMTADVLRLCVDAGLHAVSLVPAGMVFILFWRSDSTFLQVLAFPLAYVGLIVGFCVTIMGMRVLFLRRITPGRYRLCEPEAIRWIVWDSFMRMFHRSFLHGYLEDFGPLRYIFYRSLGARIDSTFFFGWNTKITDPWGIEVGRDVIIGSFVVIISHAVEGDTVFLERVKIGDRATIGARAFLMPGVEIGAGAIVGACSLVPKNTRIPAGEIWAGVPAKKIGAVGNGEAGGGDCVSAP